MGAHDDVRAATKAIIAIGRLRGTAAARYTCDLARVGGYKLASKQFHPGKQKDSDRYDSED